MREYLLDFAERLGHWGYLVIFIVVMLECQALLGLFMPGESLVLMSGFLAGQGAFDLDALIVTVSVAAIVGDGIGFALGRHLGRDWLVRHGHWIGVRESHLDKVDSYFQRHRGKSVLASHFMHVLRALMPFMAGASEMRYWSFFLPNALGCVLWASIFALLGYLFGQSWDLLEKWIGRAGAIVGSMLLFLFALGWLWRWSVRHEVELRRQWHAVLANPRVAAFRDRFEPQIAFLQNRLTPGGYLGLHLTIGALIIVLGCWWFGGIVEDLVTHDRLYVIDQRLALWMHRHATPPLTSVAQAITFLGSVPFLTCASVAVAAWLLWHRLWHRLLTWVLAVGGGSLLNLVLKTLFHRQRPAFENPIVTFASYSFPSGHTMGSTLFYGLLALFVAMYARRWRWRVFAMLAAFLVITLVALTRIYLGAHYLSDVMGAMAAGMAWLAFCLTAVETIRRRTANRPD
jgi:membrane protein DedA with SNARE-associated domain/membrane-associated phospholipid phosphatase